VGIFWLLRPPAWHLSVAGRSWRTTNLTPTITGYVTVLVAVPLAVSVVAGLPRRAERAGALAVAHAGAQKRPTLLRAVPLLIGAALFLGLASGGALVLNGAMKVLFERPRPHLAWATVLPDYSFPSGHTMNAFVFYVALALIAWSVFGRRVGLIAVAVAVAVALGVGVSRIYLGYHYLTDVVGGLVAGIAWLLVVGAAFHARPKWWPWDHARTPESSTPDGSGTAAVR